MKFRFVLMAAGIGIIASCLQVDPSVTEDSSLKEDKSIQKVVFEVKPIIDDDAQTRAGAVPQLDNSVDFAWEATDTIGVYPDTGSQIYFLPTDGIGTSSVEFTGGGWALKSNSSYVSYYPFVGDIYLKRNKIPVSFVGQKQVGTAGPFYGARYFLATEPTTSSGGVLRFTYNTLNTIINVNATLPAGTYTKASLIITEPNHTSPLFVEKGTYNMADRTIVGTKHSKTLEIEMENVTLAAQGTIPIYFMAAPIDLTGKEVTVRINASDGRRYKCVKTPTAPYQAGRRRGLTCAMVKDADIINFADSEVKRICVENWDEDGDGELDLEEAAAVTDLGSFFQNNKQISSFNELQYFSGLSILENTFLGCSNLTSVVIPSNISTIKHAAFASSGLQSILLPDGITIFGEGAFGRTNLTSLDLPRVFFQTGTYGGFTGCQSLTSVSFSGPIICKAPSSSQFEGCINLRSLFFDENFSFTCYQTVNGSIGDYEYFSIPQFMWSSPNPSSIPPISSINVSSENSLFDSRDGCNALIETLSNSLLLACENTVIPETVTCIGPHAFLLAKGLTSITIPQGVTSIGSSAFYSCKELSSVIVLPTAPPVLQNNVPFSLEKDGFTVFVPSESVNDYKTADGWSRYSDYIRSFEGGTTPGSGNDGDD